MRGAEAELVGKADELGEPGGLHLPHDLAAMHLDGHLADPELAGDLLVEPAGDDEAQDLSLAGGQGLKAGPQFGEAHLVGAADAVLFKRDTDPSSRSWSRNGLVRNSTAPAFIARTDIGMSP